MTNTRARSGGGAVYQDNGDGTFTVLDRGSMQPASGFSCDCPRRPEVPSFKDAPKEFSTAFVAVVLPGQEPSAELLERADAIRRRWIACWSRVTGGLGTMNTRLDAETLSGAR